MRGDHVWKGWRWRTDLQGTRKELQMALENENVPARSLELESRGSAERLQSSHRYSRRKRADFGHHRPRESTAT